jgi:hypothetical protein
MRRPERVPARVSWLALMLTDWLVLPPGSLLLFSESRIQCFRLI